MKRLLLILTLCTSAFTFPQTRADSLLRELPQMSKDSSRVQALIDLSWIYYRNDLNTGLDYATRAVQLASELQLTEKQAAAYRIRSFCLSGLGRHMEADSAMIRALHTYEQEGNLRMIANTYAELGWLKRLLGQPEAAVQYFLQSVDLANDLGDKNTEAQAYNYMAGLYKDQDQYDKAAENYSKALALVREIKLRPGISACLTNLASIYVDSGQFDQALELNEEALAMKREDGDRLGAGRVLNNMGIAYNKQQRFMEAEAAFDEAMKLAEEVGDRILITTVTNGYAEAAFGRRQYEKAIALSESLLPQLDHKADLKLVRNTHRRLFLSYGALGRYSDAYGSALLWEAAADSLYNENILATTNELEAKYQNQQKSREIALLASEKDLQELQLTKRENERNGIIAISLLAVLLAGVVFNQYRIKQRSNRELIEVDRLKSNFFANVSHEFRTPLTLIKGPIEHLEQNPGESLGREDLKMMRRNINRVLGLVSQLLDLSRIDRGKMQLVPTEGDVFKCLRAAAFSFNSHAAQRGMEYKVDIPQEQLWAAFDRDKLEKVVYNLLSNAFKFSDDGETVSFRAIYRGDELTLEVGDSGKGIAQEHLPFIFDRFYQADSSPTRSQEGSGIGLSLSRNLVELMDGTITVSSELHKGTYFTVQLPLQRIRTRQKSEAAKIAAREKPASRPPAFKFPVNDARKLPEILLVEDNDDMRHFIRQRLQESYRVAEARNGEEGLKAARRDIPDLIISDLMMPRMDGVELCKQLRSHVETSHIPLIMLTARAGAENRIEGLETGADDYLTKPFDARELLVRVRNLIDQRALLKERFAQGRSPLRPDRMPSATLDEQFLQQLSGLFQENYTDADFGQTDMQQALAMSKTQLHRKIKALTGETPGELLRNFRLRAAADLLTQEADTVTQIAYRVGFNNLSYFAKCFKEVYGTSPSAYAG